MKKLTKNQGQTIASLINSMECSEIMMSSARKEGRFSDYRFHQTNWANTVIELGEMGIELPNYELCVELKAERIAHEVKMLNREVA